MQSITLSTSDEEEQVLDFAVKLGSRNEI